MKTADSEHKLHVAADRVIGACMRNSEGMDRVVDNVAHRPWPLPKRPWMMTQRWSDLLFLHWPVQTDLVRSLVPAAIDLDLWHGTTWLTVTPLWLSNLRLRGAPPVPWASEFAEINVRTYVSIDARPGVYFFSLDAARLLAVIGARASFHLPYYHAEMSVRRLPGDAFEYRSRRKNPSSNAAFVATYAPDGPVARAEQGTLDHWLTERYCLYAADSRGAVYRAEIHHDQWPLQPATVDVRENTMATAAGITLPDIAPRVAFARRLDVLVWSKERVR
jgi:uncharacterized protein YqjF (DUF2071 family)